MRDLPNYADDLSILADLVSGQRVDCHRSARDHLHPAGSVPEPVHSAMPDSHEPDLGVEAARKETVRRCNRVSRQLKITTDYVNGHDLSMVAGFYLLAHLLFIEFCPEASVFFFAVTRLSHAHGCLDLQIT
jgi:hypothetical protein